MKKLSKIMFCFFSALLCVCFSQSIVHADGTNFLRLNVFVYDCQTGEQIERLDPAPTFTIKIYEDGKYVRSATSNGSFWWSSYLSVGTNGQNGNLKLGSRYDVVLSVPGYLTFRSSNGRKCSTITDNTFSFVYDSELDQLVSDIGGYDIADFNYFNGVHVHTWFDTWPDGTWSGKTATCSQEGYREYHCDICGETKEEPIPKNSNHKWGEWKTASAATVSKAGTQIRTCALCGKTETQTVGTPLPGTISVSAASLTLQKGQTTSALKVSGIAKGDSVKSVKSGNKKILEVVSFSTKGTIKLKAQDKTGKTTLTITLKSGQKKKVTVKVQSNTVKTTKLSGIPKTLTIKKGGMKTLKPTIMPITSQQKVTYTTSDKNVATVSSKGVVKAKKKGKAKITVKSGAKKVTVTVTVK